MIKGIDISHYQGDIHWPAVDDDIKFVFIKATEGTTWTDDHFHKNVSGAKSAKKKVGAYHFARFNDVATAKAEAHHFLSYVGDYDLDFHILDIEVGSGDLTEESQAFFDVLKEHNRKGLILYTYSNFLKNHFSHDLAGIKLWIAHYGVKEPEIYYWHDWAAWQHSSDGEVNGIKGRVDLNFAKEDLFIEQLDYVKPKKITESYRIKSGDTFWELEQQNGWKHGTLKDLNPHLDPKRLSIGQKIHVPASDDTYIIKRGDTFWELEVKEGWEHGILEKLNPHVDPRRLRIGQEIKVPRGN